MRIYALYERLADTSTIRGAGLIREVFVAKPPEIVKKTVRRFCDKIVYSTESEADKSAEWHGYPFSSYYCRKCLGYHLTTSQRTYNRWLNAKRLRFIQPFNGRLP